MAYYRSLLDLRARLGLEREVGFVYETGEIPEEGSLISVEDVAGLMRAADVMFMPSHREGFGMPVIEAGLLGIPVVCSSAVPAGQEIGGEDVHLFDSQAGPEEIAQMIAGSVMETSWYRLRRRIRGEFSWEQIFHQKIEPFLKTGRE
jgi:glycosyltransferase involved in cell wall biosynthesis